MEEVVRILEVKPGEDAGPAAAPAGPGPESLHALNNSLAGIISYVSLVMAERKADPELQQKLGLVLEAAKKVGDTLKKKP
jgi:hypothetical protein